MQKKLKKIIIILVIMVLILIVAIMILIKKVSKQKPNQEIKDALKTEREEFEEIQENPALNINGQKLEEVKLEGIYLTVERAIKKYQYYLVQGNSEAVYSLLNNICISKNEITKENIFQKVEKFSNYTIDQMMSVSTVNYGIYYIKINSIEGEKFIIINWDTERDTFDVYPINQEEYNIAIREGLKIEKERVNSIEKNEFNKVIIEKTDNDTIAQTYFYGFIESVVNNPQKAYELIDSEYKEKCFKTYDDFLEYVTANKQRLISLDHNNLKKSEEFENYEEYEAYYQETKKNKMSNYSQETVNNMKIYTFIDTYGKYYIFKVSAAMKYTVLMDTYSVSTEDFIETYNASKDNEKVVLNIKKFFMGIDDKNYGYSYNVLADSFKNNKYPTKNDFINYVKQNFFEKNKIEYINYTEENGVYIYKIKVSDAMGKIAKAKQFNIIIRLKEGTNFEMSFGEN